MLALGAIVGAVIAGLLAPLARGSFGVPGNGVGWVTAAQYPKGFDYFVIVALVAGTFMGGLAAAFMPARENSAVPAVERRRPRWRALALITFVLMCFIHDHPYSFMDPFHEGEHLTPAFLLRDGGRPYRDMIHLHGLAFDGGLDALVIGDPPSPLRERRLATILNAAALALLAPLAAEVCATSFGVAAALLGAVSIVGAGQVPVFPYLRWIPMLIAAIALLRYARNGGARLLFLAFAASTLGLLWSVDVGVYATAGTIAAFVLMRIGKLEAVPLDWKGVVLIAIGSALLPIVVLAALRGDVVMFFKDSFITVPASIDAISSLPAPTSWSWETSRYYLPPIFYALLLVLALRAWARGEKLDAARLVVIAMMSLLIFRTASGRCGWSHLRFGIPLLGIALIAFVLEPLILAKRRIAAIAFAVLLVVFLEVVPNVVTGAKMLAGWRARRSHTGLVPYPLATGKGIYTYEQNATELAALNGFIAREAPAGTILDLSNERALYYLLQRKPAIRCSDVAMLAAPPFRAEAMAQLESAPPACVIVEGLPEVDVYDGMPNEKRVPWLFAWVDEHYPRREKIGRFVVATR
jgi:hypothetical protein